VRPAGDVNAADAKKSPDGKLEAIVSNYNVAIRPFCSTTKRRGSPAGAVR